MTSKKSKGRSNGERPGNLGETADRLQAAEAKIVELEQALQARDHLTATILNVIPDLVFLVSHDGTYLEYWGSEKDTYRLPEAFLGKKVEDVMPPEFAPDIMHSIEQAISSGTPQVLEFELSEKEGKRCYESRFIACCEDKVVAFARDITDRKAAEGALMDSRNLLQSMIDTLPFWISVKDSEGRYLVVNDSMAADRGMSKEEFLDHTISINQIESFSGRVLEMEALDRLVLMTGNKTGLLEYEAVLPDDIIQKRHIAKFPLKDIAGSNVGIISWSEDITERKRIEEEMRRTRISIDRNIDSVFWVNQKGEFIDVNDSSCQSLGYSRAELLNMNIGDIAISTEDAQGDYASTIFPQRFAAIKKNGNLKFNSTHKKKDGIQIPVEITANYVHFDGKEFICGIARDMTERKQAEESLQESEQRALVAHALLMDAIESINEGFALYDVDDHLVLWNQKFYDLNTEIKDLLKPGVSFESIVRATAERHQVVGFEGREEEWVQERLINHKNSGGSFERQKRDGRWFLANERQTREGGIVGTWTEITQRKQAEEELKENQKRLQNFIDMSPSNLAYIDQDQIFRQVNARYLVFYGRPEKEVVGKSISEVHGGEVFEELNPHVKEVLEGRAVSFEVKRPLRDQGVRDLEVKYIPETDQSGNVLGFFAAVQDITERKQAEEELRETKRLLETVFNTIPLEMAIKDREGRYIRVNHAWLEFSGLSHEEVLNKTSMELLGKAEEDRINMHQKDQMILSEDGSDLNFEHTRFNRFGDKRTLQSIRSQIRDEEDNVVGLVSVALDITERKRAEEALRESEEHFRAITNATPFPLVISRPGDGAILYSNEATKRAFVNEGDFPDRKVGDFYWDPDERLEMLALLEKEGSFTNQERRFRKANGEMMISLHSAQVLNFKDKPAILSGLIDITQLKRAEEALRENEVQLRNFIDLSPTNLVFIDRNLVYQQVNQGFLTMVGKTMEEVVGHTMSEIVEEDALAMAQPWINKVLGGEEQLFEFERHVKDIGIRDVEVRYVPAFDPQGCISGFYGSGNDITERKRMEETLRENEERLRNFIDLSPANLVFIDRDLVYQQVNQGYLTLVGKTMEEVIGHTMSEIVEENAFAMAQPRIKKVLGGEEQLFVFERQVKDIGIRDVEVRYVPAFDSQGRISGFYASVNDITERKQAEKKLKESEARLQEAQKIAHLGHWERDIPSGKTVWSDEVYRIFGVDPDVFTPTLESFLNLIHPEDRALNLSTAEKVIQENKSHEVQVRIIRPDGTERVVHNTIGIVTFDEANQPSKLRGVVFDITEQKRAEGELRSREALLQAVFDTVPHWISVRDTNHRYLMVNHQRTMDTGISSDEYRNMDIDHLPYSMESERTSYVSTDDQVMETGKTLDIPSRMIQLSNGRIRYHHTIKTPLRSGDGTISGTVTVTEDVTEKELAAQELRKSRAAEDLAKARLLKAIENQLVQREEQLQEYFEISVQGIYIHSDHKILFANDALSNLLGYADRNDIINIGNQLKLYAPQEHDRLRGYYETRKDGGSVPNKFEFQGLRKDGTTIWLECSVQMLNWKNTSAVLVTATDVADKKEAILSLRESEERLKSVLENAADGIFTHDQYGTIETFNQSAEKIFGYAREEVLNRNIAMLIPPEYREKHENGMKRIQEVPWNRLGSRFELSGLRKDGSRILLAITIGEHKVGNNRMYTGIVRDITEQKRAEEELRKSERQLRHAQEIAHLGYWERDLRTQALEWNEETYRIFGVDPERFKPTFDSALDHVHPDDRELLKDSSTQQVERGWKYSSEYRIVRSDGSIRDVQSQGEYIFDEKGRPQKLICAIQDITERKHAERELRNSEEKYRNLVEISMVGIIIHRDFKPVFVNQSYAKMFGYESPDEVLQMESLDTVIHPEDRAEIRNKVKKALDGEEGATHVQYRGVRKNGEIIYLESYAKNINWEGIPARMGAITDLTLRRKTEEIIKLQEQQLIQADKMASLGILVSGVAHEINNPNAFITFNAPILAHIWEEAMPILKHHQAENGDFSLASLSLDKAAEAVPKLLSGISHGAKRINNIVGNLKDFARQNQSGEFNPVNLNAVLESAVTLLSNEINKRTKYFSMEFGADLPTFLGDFQKIEQVVINLITNACQALPDTEKCVRVKTDYDTDLAMVRLTVADEGEGILPEDLSKIMDPFFTTKRESGGTGLGLSVSYSIIEEHGGQLNFSSIEGQGTTAIISLPFIH